MTDRPIIFSAPMVRAILREIDAPGTGKTQTRRVLKLPVKGVYEHPKMGGWAASTIGGAGCYLDPAHTIPAPERPCVWHQTTGDVILPSVKVGDRLWVREEMRFCSQMDHLAPAALSPYEPRVYSADSVLYQPACMLIEAGKRRPSIHMPRWASRLTLIVTDVRVQRLQDISADDARAEGVDAVYDPGADDGAPAYLDYRIPDQAFGGFGAARLSFSTLWDSLHPKPGTGWDSNPWVAAISFTPRLGNIDSEGAA